MQTQELCSYAGTAPITGIKMFAQIKTHSDNLADLNVRLNILIDSIPLVLLIPHLPKEELGRALKAYSALRAEFDRFSLKVSLKEMRATVIAAQASASGKSLKFTKEKPEGSSVDKKESKSRKK